MLLQDFEIVVSRDNDGNNDYDCHHHLYHRQMTNGMYMRMAILSSMLSTAP